MKITELQIGDWVEQVQDLVPFAPIKIEEIRRECVIFGNGLCKLNFNEINPIPLTAEILEKNGFEECRIDEIEYYGWRLNEDFSLELNTVDTLIWNDDVTIHYVHELQHALRLCRINKEIELCCGLITIKAKENETKS